MRFVILLLLLTSVCCAQNTTGAPSTTAEPEHSGHNYMRSMYILAGVSAAIVFALTVACLCIRRRERGARAVRDVIPASHQFSNPVFSDPSVPPYRHASPIYPYLSSGLPFSYTEETITEPR